MASGRKRKRTTHPHTLFVTVTPDEAGGVLSCHHDAGISHKQSGYARFIRETNLDLESAPSAWKTLTPAQRSAYNRRAAKAKRVVSHKVYSSHPTLLAPGGKDNPFPTEFTAIWPNWTVQILSSDRDAPGRFMHSVTLDDVRRTYVILRDITSSSLYRKDEIVIMNKCAGNLERFEQHFWSFVMRVLLSVVATRFVYEDLLRLHTLRTERAKQYREDVHGVRFRLHKDIVARPIQPDKADLDKWMYRFSLIVFPGWQTTSGRMRPPVHALHALTQTLIRVSQSDVQSPMCSTARLLPCLSIERHAAMMLMPMGESFETLSDEHGIAMDPILTILPPQVVRALKTLLSVKEQDKVLEVLPMPSEEKAKFSINRLESNIGAAFVAREIISSLHLLGESLPLSHHITSQEEPIFSSQRNDFGRTGSVTSVTGRALQKHYAKRLGNKSKVSFMPSVPVGHMPLCTGFPGWEQGVFDCWFGPVIHFCEGLFGDRGVKALHRQQPSVASPSGRGVYAFRAQGSFEWSDERLFTEALLKRARDSALDHFSKETWVPDCETTREDIESHYDRAEAFVSKSLKRPGERIARPRAHPQAMPRRWHLERLQGRIQFSGGRVRACAPHEA